MAVQSPKILSVALGIGLSGVGLFLGAVNVEAVPVQTEAKTEAPKEAAQPSAPEPRYRLAPDRPEPNYGIRSDGEHTGLQESDFTWEALTRNGPASGADPVLGEPSGHSYFDFKDGLEHPYYILKLSHDS